MPLGIFDRTTLGIDVSSFAGGRAVEQASQVRIEFRGFPFVDDVREDVKADPLVRFDDVRSEPPLAVETQRPSIGQAPGPERTFLEIARHRTVIGRRERNSLVLELFAHFSVPPSRFGS